MIVLSFSEVQLLLSSGDYDALRAFLSEAIDVLPIATVKKYEQMLGNIGVGYQTYSRLYKEKVIDYHGLPKIKEW
ncbi:MAG: hypothetical protein EBR30_22135 [Cytophagia bacterium]|nr:hypothetical protein [Cytophagia bacterium]